MITLGINAAFHDSSAALVVDGTVVAAAEEERFTRIKHGKRPVPFSAWELPFNAIDSCLARARITLNDVTHVAYSFDPVLFVDDPAVLDERRIAIPMALGNSKGAEWHNAWDPLFLSEIVNAPGQLADGAPHHLRKRFARAGGKQPNFRWHFVDHHLSHQASAFLASPFRQCAVMTLDGRGERATTTFGRYRDDSYEKLGEVLMPHSLGILYERITDHLGFLHSSDEYKVMALAALGEPRNFEYLNSKIRVSGGSFELAPIDFEEVFGPKRRLGEELTQSHFDAAASVQKVLETTVLALARWLRRESGEQQLAVAGGVALNCVMNSVLRDSGIFNQVWIQPAAGDAGTALGAALWIDAQQRAPTGASADRGANRLAPRHWQMRDAYLGPEFSDTEIEHQLTWAKLEYTRVDDLAEATAKLLADNCVIGWFQGRMEFGPRALGARSILASPIDPDMQKRINELKDREDFRPVAPMVLKEKMSDWFTPAEANDGESPFMLFLYNVAPGQARNIPSACHVDETARVQTVDRESNPQVHALLEAFGRRTGVPVLINTSFNVRGEPIVCTPKAAIEAFFSTPLDALVMGSFVVLKAGQTHRQTS
jgi:carbamoyltransferase